MSVRCITKVLDASQHAGTELLMLVVLADYSDDDGNSYPAVASLARKCRMTSRNAIYILNALQASGELRVLKNEGPKGTNRYKIMLNNLGGEPLRPASPLKAASPLKPTSATPEAGFPKPLKPTSDEPSLNRHEPSEQVATSVASSTPADAESKPKPLKKSKAPKNSKPKTDTTATWEAYTQAFRAKYGTDPVRHAQVNSQMAAFIRKLGEVEAPAVAEFYVQHPGAFYAKCMHNVGALVKDADQLRTQWKTGRLAPDGPPDRVSAAERRVAEMLPGLASPEVRARLGQQRRVPTTDFSDVDYREGLNNDQG